MKRNGKNTRVTIQNNTESDKMCTQTNISLSQQFRKPIDSIHKNINNCYKKTFSFRAFYIHEKKVIGKTELPGSREKEEVRVEAAKLGRNTQSRPSAKRGRDRSMSLNLHPRDCDVAQCWLFFFTYISPFPPPLFRQNNSKCTGIRPDTQLSKTRDDGQGQ